MIDSETGEITPPAGTNLAFPPMPALADLPQGMRMPQIPDFAKGFGLGGAGGDILTGLTEGLVKQGFDDFSFQQGPDGILDVNGTGDFKGVDFAFLPNSGGITQGNSGEAGLSVDENGFFVVTTPDGQKVPMIPAPRDPSELLDLINADPENQDNGLVTVGESGDILMNLPGQNRCDVGMFIPQIDPAPEGLLPGVNFVPNEDGDEEGWVVYDDGAAQQFRPTVPNPPAFINAGLQFPGVEGIDLQADGSLVLEFQGQELRLKPNFNVQNTPLTEGQIVEPSIVITPEGGLEFTVAVGDEVLTVPLDIEVDQ